MGMQRKDNDAACTYVEDEGCIWLNESRVRVGERNEILDFHEGEEEDNGDFPFLFLIKLKDVSWG